MTAAMGSSIRYILDGDTVTVTGVDPARTVLQHLREDLHRTGTKEGCAEGDCGACTVVLAEPDGGGLRYRAMNSCIQFLPTLDGKAVFTVESLAGAGGALHPVQQALVDCHGSQCGFCTPGFVMSLFALYKSAPYPGRRGVDAALAGNLCRCTGYRPIVDAARRMYELGERLDDAGRSLLTAPAGAVSADEASLAARLEALRPVDTVTVNGGGCRYHAPVGLPALLELAAAYPDDVLLAGGTDVGLWVTKQYRVLEGIIYVGNVAELRRIERGASHLEMGAAVTLTDAFPVILDEYPELEELFLRFASPPVRNTATLGGNVANGSPIGDSMPALMAGGATVVLAAAGGRREMPLEEFYLDYQTTARRPGEVLECIRIPRRQAGMRVAAYKISKRFDQDISTVCAAFVLECRDGRVHSFRAGFGGLATIPKRATACESALTGGSWDEPAVAAAMEALDRDFAPLTDMRASLGYRRRVMKNLLYRFYLHTGGSEPGDAAATDAASLYAYGR